MAVSEELAKVYASAPVAQSYIETLELYHSQFPIAGNTFWLNNTHKARTFKLDDNATDQLFDPVPFVVTLPAADGNGQQDLNIVISNIGLLMSDALEAANEQAGEPITAVYRVYLDQSTDLVQSDPIRLSITDVSMGVDAVNAVARNADILNRAFPSEVYRTDIFPGLNR